MAAAVNPQLLPISKLTCGFCGFVSPHFSADPNNVWSPYYRAVYAVGPLDSHEPPRLSGVGFHRHDREDNYVPARADQRWDDHDDVSGGEQQQQQLGPAPLRPPPPELVRIRDIKAPGPEVPAHEQLDYAWGFLFHEACWSVLEQAVKPREVDIPTIWRILCSVPCGSELPNWGHNYGGLYMGTMRDQARGEHFVLLGRNSNLVIPSTFSNPFRVPDLEKLVLQNRIVAPSSTGAGRGDVIGEPGREISGVGRPGSRDPFAALPLELKEMLLCYMGSATAASARLASRALASTPLAQPFFQSRFWPGREMGAFFDGFLLPAADVRGTDWRRLYWQHKVRLKYNRVCLGERNRLRLWTSTIWPLAEAMGRVRAASELRGGPDWRWNGGGGSVAAALEADWKICRTAKLQAPMVFGEIRRVVHRAEVQFPPGARVTGARVSFIDFFGSRYVTGLRFVFDGDTDDDYMELGYVMRSSEEHLPVPSGCLAGFHCATDECGFRALALAEGKGVASEYLNWAGRPEALTVMVLKSAAKDGVKRVRASFDGFRLQALLIPER